jgi:malonate transporter and related proteins
MTLDLYVKLSAIMLTIGLGALLPRLPFFRADREGRTAIQDPAHALAQLATYVLVPALLFRTMARMDLSHMPWHLAQSYFAPMMLCALSVYAWQRPRRAALGAAAPATRATAAVYGNAVQLGIPLSLAVYGEAGLAIHIALVSLHGVLMLTTLTLLAEFDLSRADRRAGLLQTLGAMIRSTLVHPVVLPVLLGLSVNLTGFGLPAVIDQVLSGLSVAVIPMCLLLIGMNLAHYGLRGTWRPAVPQVLVKLFLMPAAVLVAGRWVFGLQGLPLQVAVMMAALPTGSNALIFAQRYRLLQGEATAVIVIATLGFTVTAPLWLALADRWAG